MGEGVQIIFPPGGAHPFGASRSLFEEIYDI
jgi:hypothetical protein